ncbi:nucleotidyltransferase domain-containing protein [Candidatus Pacearchaeota archaeon]|nr:nucleotidyltransferase domain-containing protein [Candidatus Pacearchaeota archaeon]
MAETKKSKPSVKDFPTLNIVKETDIAMDFATKAYKKFDKLIKSVILFGSTVRKTTNSNSDIDIILLVDDASVKFDQELVAWYRGELGKIIAANPYKRELHINTVRLTTWWQDVMRGDPIAINMIRYGEEILDFGGFFRPLRILLQEGKIKSTPEAIYTCLERAPIHLVRSKNSLLSAVEGVYWAMVESAHALLMTAKITPASPEHIPMLLKENFVDRRMLDAKYVAMYRDVFTLHKAISYGEVKEIEGYDIDEMQANAQKFIGAMAEVIRKLI